MTLSALKSSCALAAAMLALTAVSVPQMALAAAKADSCKPAKAVHKTKVHKPKAKKARTLAVAHKARSKAKVIKVATAPCDCAKSAKIVKVVRPVVEREVTVYRAEPRKWHAPYVDEVRTGHYATYKETSRHEETSRTTTRVVQRFYIRNDHYLTADSRPGRHRHTRWTRWID